MKISRAIFLEKMTAENNFFMKNLEDIFYTWSKSLKKLPFSRGINIRYIGKVATCLAGKKDLEHVYVSESYLYRVYKKYTVLRCPLN
jgi:hypothetical protein